jgi:tetratricopeptide (TPR) repeat protein
MNPAKKPSESRSLGGTLLAGVCILVVLMALLMPRVRGRHAEEAAGGAAGAQGVPGGGWHATQSGHGHHGESVATAEEIVATKLKQFAANRMGVAQALAKRAGVEPPAEVGQFFAAVEAGNWDEAHALFQTLYALRHSANPPPGLMACWSAVMETYGVTQQAHQWPAQKLLDYGNAILNSLRPGMVYVGGTDPGRFIPTLLNETGAGQSRIVLTQNALADSDYLDYVNFLYGDQLTGLSKQESQSAFENYLADAGKRLTHDQQFPDEPKQMLPNENVTFGDNGQTQASGDVAVMKINELLLQTLMQKNPNLSFGLEESFPLKSTYPGAAVLGPIMELNAGNQNPMTADAATQAVDYWRNTAQQLLSDPDATGSHDTMLTYSHEAVAQANLLASHNFNDQAEAAFRLATQLAPDNSWATTGLAQLLAGQGHADQANQLLDTFVQNHPDQRSEVDSVRQAMAGKQ